jgi:transcriptional regulator of heat shock response
MYVRECLEPSQQEQIVRKKFASLKEQYFERKDQESVHEAVALLTHMIPNVAFATVPHKDRVFYLGLGNALKQPEFQSDPLLASGIAEVLEGDLASALKGLEIDEEVRYYIGEQNVMEQIHSCSMMVTSYKVRGAEGVIGVLGPMRMDYRYNTVALELISDLLRSE